MDLWWLGLFGSVMGRTGGFLRSFYGKVDNPLPYISTGSENLDEERASLQSHELLERFYATTC